MKKNIILGIETSCDDTSIAVISNGETFPEILSFESFSQEQMLSAWGGVVPEIAARNHLDKIAPRLGNERGIGRHAIKQAGFSQLFNFTGLSSIDKKFHRIIRLFPVLVQPNIPSTRNRYNGLLILHVIAQKQC